jgi:GntR family transcriptional regulator, transcriptional repressor for pyruvate dehydrogenase complex
MSNDSIFSQPLTRSRLHEEIVSIIQKQILTGALAPGIRLPPERELAESLQVNRATVREALRKLEYLELLEIRHGDGVYVRNYMESGNIDLIKAIVTINEGDRPISDVLEVRRIVVPEMACLAAQRRSNTDLDDLERIIFHDDLAILERDIKVHQIIARAARNMLYTIMLNFFNQLFRDQFCRYFENKHNVERSGAFHRDIFAAIRDQQTGEARRVMMEVLVFAETAVMDDTRRNT